MKKILIIPHHPDFRFMKIRLPELAKYLGEDFDIYLLDWHSAFGKCGIFGRCQAVLKDLFKLPMQYSYQGLKIIEFPMLHRPLFFAPSFNSFWLMRTTEKLKIDIVVNGSYYLFSIPKDRNFSYIVDLADIPAGQRTGSFDIFIEKRVSEEMQKTDAVTVCSRGLVDYVKKFYNLAAYFLPNGTDVSLFNKIAAVEVDHVLDKYGLKGKWVIGYLGFMGTWVDIEFLVNTFYEVKKQVPNAALFLVGSSPKLVEYKKRFSAKDIIFTGIIREKIEKYFLACNVGVIPHRKSDFQDLAFHIKLIEFSAARKFVVTSDMEEVKKLNFPNVLIKALDKNKWVDALLKARSSHWDNQWDKLIENYDWHKIRDRFKDLVNSLYHS